MTQRNGKRSKKLYDRAKLLGTLTLILSITIIAAGVFVVGYVSGTKHPIARSFDVLTGNHWASAQRVVTVEDRTGNVEWMMAEQHAVDVWNRALSRRADIKLVWSAVSTYPDGCKSDGTNVGVCRKEHIVAVNSKPSQAVFRATVGPDRVHLSGAYIELDSSYEGQWNQMVKDSIMCHEAGHVLAIAERTGPGSHDSCMTNDAGFYPTGPDAEDIRLVQGVYAHSDS